MKKNVKDARKAMLKVVKQKSLNSIFEVEYYLDKNNKKLKFGDVIEYELSNGTKLKFFIDFEPSGIVLYAVNDDMEVLYDYPNYHRNCSNNMAPSNVMDVPYKEDIEIIE